MHRNPRRLFEIKSGNSTKFARRTISDHKRTAITSIDRHPFINSDVTVVFLDILP